MTPRLTTARRTGRGRGASSPRIVRPRLGEPPGLPGDDVPGSVIYGGPFNVFEEDRYPILKAEAARIRESLGRGLPKLGICRAASRSRAFCAPGSARCR
jgi:GMP synthase-like glutamine amidotransferase